HGPGVDAGLRGDLLGVGDRGAGALTVELPGVEGAADVLALDATAIGEVGAEVRAEGVEHLGGAGLGAEEDHVLAEVAHGLDVAGLQLVAEADDEPAKGIAFEGVRPVRTCTHGGPPGDSTRTCSSWEKPKARARPGRSGAFLRVEAASLRH